MRCLIVTMDASVIIGKGGRHIAEIRVSCVFLVLLFDFVVLCSAFTAFRRMLGESVNRVKVLIMLAHCASLRHRAKPTLESTFPNPSLETPSGSSAFKVLWTRLPRSVPPYSCSSAFITPFRTSCTDLARLTYRVIHEYRPLD